MPAYLAAGGKLGEAHCLACNRTQTRNRCVHELAHPVPASAAFAFDNAGGTARQHA
jgi:hypothetical protein